MRKLIVALVAALCVTGCSENYANGERIGLVTQFSQSGALFKSWEGHLNLTQTGMNSSSAVPFDFSIDNDRPDSAVINTIKAAADSGWKVKLTYHQTLGKNWLNNRGETSHFVTSAEVLDKNPVASAFNGGTHATATGKTIDTVYVVIVGRASDKK